VVSTSHHSLEFLLVRLEKEGAIMYQISVYPITPNLWRWEIRCGGALLRCGTAYTRVEAERDVNKVVHT
jgi:hypothetical protein